MVATGIFEFAFLLLFALGDSGRLSDYVETDGYWTDLGIEVSVNSMMAELRGPGSPPQEVDAWVTQLGAASYEEREEASRNLAEAGASTRAGLEQAATSKDPEVRLRARALLDQLPDKEIERSDVRAQMAILALSRIGTPEAEKALEDLKKGDGKMATLADRLVGDRSVERPGSLELLERLPQDAHAVLQLELRRNPGALIQEVHRSPGIQVQLREIWELVGEVQVDRITACANADMMQVHPAGHALIWVEGQFQPEAFFEILGDAGFDQNREMWVQDEMTVLLHPEGTLAVLILHPAGQPDKDVLEQLVEMLLGEEAAKGFPPAVAELLPKEVKPGSAVAAIRVTEKVPDFLGLEGNPESVEAEVLRGADREHARLWATFADPVPQKAFVKLVEGQIEDVQQEFGQQDGPEVRSILEILKSVKIKSEGDQVQVSFSLLHEAKLQWVRQLEQGMSMIHQIEIHNHRGIRHQQLIIQGDQFMGNPRIILN